MVAIFLTLALTRQAQTAPIKLGDPVPIHRWLDSCRFDFVGKPFVEADDRSEGVPKKSFGFLCRAGEAFEVMTVGLRVLRFGQPATYRAIDLKSWLDRSEQVLVRSPDYRFPPKAARSNGIRPVIPMESGH